MLTPFEITRVTVLEWEKAGLIDLPCYEDLAMYAHDLSISIGMLLGIAMPDSWDALPQEARTPLAVFAQRIVEERLGMSEFHDILCENLVAQGYSYGEDDDAKLTSSVLVPYSNLPAHVRIMDACFEAGVIWALRAFYPGHFDLMPPQNDEWVMHQAIMAGDTPQGH